MTRMWCRRLACKAAGTAAPQKGLIAHGYLGEDVDSSALGEMFAPHGTVKSAQIITDRDTGRSKCFGFVEMSSDKEAQAAIGAMNGQDGGGRHLTVNGAKPKESRSSGGYGRGR